MKQTREQAEALLAVEMDALTKQQAKVARLSKLITNMATKEADLLPMTMSLALETFLNDGRTDFEKGRKFLEELTWKGAWKGTGLQYSGSYWPGSRQRVLKLALDYNWDDAKLVELEKLMLTVLPDMKTDNFRTQNKGGEAVILGSFNKKAPTIDAQTLKVFDIFEHDLSAGGDYQLGVLPDGSAVVFDIRRPSYGLEKTGTLLECLQFVRTTYWYEGGPRSDDDDCGCC